MNIVFQSNNQVRLWATITNAVYQFRQYSTQNGLKWPGKIVAYAQWAQKTGDASAPMLGYVKDPLNTSGMLGMGLSDTGFILGTSVLNSIGVDLPDITIKKKASDDFNSVNLTQTLFHELAHASHYAQVGNSFWLPDIQYIVANKGYGDKSSVGSGRIALSEAWAEYVGNSFSLVYYGATIRLNNRTFNQRLEDFTPNTDPFYGSPWIPYGSYYDMNDGYSSGEPNDNVNSFTLSQMYSYLTSSVTDPTAFRTKAKGGRTTTVQSSIDQLFTWYGY